jgi:hypothetical protein
LYNHSIRLIRTIAKLPTNFAGKRQGVFSLKRSQHLLWDCKGGMPVARSKVKKVISLALWINGTQLCALLTDAQKLNLLIPYCLA